MKRFLKIIIISIVVLALVIIGAYYFIMHMPGKNMAKLDPDFVIEATELAREYESAPDVSDKKYIDRVMEVTGIEAEVSRDQNNQVVIILRDEGSFTGILCTLDEKEEKEASRIAPGDQVTVKGVCTGMLFEVVLNRCIIVL